MGHRDSFLRRLVDRSLAVVAVAAIRLYQATFSHWHGRTCLFSPTCSHRAVQHFHRHGFAEGVRRTRAQLDDCCGDYSVRIGADGAVQLITRSGAVLGEHEVNPSIVARIQFPRDLLSVTAGV